MFSYSTEYSILPSLCKINHKVRFYDCNFRFEQWVRNAKHALLENINLFNSFLRPLGTLSISQQE